MRNLQKASAWLRSAIFAVAGNVSVFLLAAFIVPDLLYTLPIGISYELSEYVHRYLILPWGAALCLMTLGRREEEKLQAWRADLGVMFVMLLWVTVPFWLRFGPIASNIRTTYSFMVLFFGVYATVVTADRQQREHLLDTACALFAAFSFVFAGALLYAAWSGLDLGSEFNQFPFGVYKNTGSLCSGTHYNTTGLVGIFGSLLCLMGAVRRKHLLAKAAHLIPGIMMVLVVILTQSRTSRYALLLAFGAALYGYVASGFWNKNAIIRHAAGILAGVVMVVGGYVVAAKITDAALYRYAVVEAQRQQGKDVSVTEDAVSALARLIAADAIAEDTQAESQLVVKPQSSRGLGEMSFTGRTGIWNAAIEVWKERPLHFFIGKGAELSYRELGKHLWDGGGAIAAHNAYIQAILDYGFIGFILLLILLGMAVPPAWRIFFARPDRALPGGRLLCGVIVAALVNGMMEIEVFRVMSFTNLVFFYALAMLAAFGRDMVE